MTSARILLNEVTITLGVAPKEYHALKNINIDIKAGNRVGIIGPNGAGKSTLLRAMGGIYPPTRGEINVNGFISGLFQLGLGMQQDQTGYDNIVLNALISGQPKRIIEEKIQSIIDFADLGEFINLPLRTYSQGMAMRLKFACATGFSPEVLLLDEWLGAGDAEFQNKAKTRMKQLITDAHIVVLATHNVPLMKQICDKALWLEKGQVIMFGDIDEVIKARQLKQQKK